MKHLFGAETCVVDVRQSLKIWPTATITPLKVTGVKVYPRQTRNFRSHAVSACISLWCHRPMHAHHILMHACTAGIAPWCHRLMHAVTAWAPLFWFHLGYTFISSYFDSSVTVSNDFTKTLPIKILLRMWLYYLLTYYRQFWLISIEIIVYSKREEAWIARPLHGFTLV